MVCNPQGGLIEHAVNSHSEWVCFLIVKVFLSDVALKMCRFITFDIFLDIKMAVLVQIRMVKLVVFYEMLSAI